MCYAWIGYAVGSVVNIGTEYYNYEAQKKQVEAEKTRREKYSRDVAKLAARDAVNQFSQLAVRTQQERLRGAQLINDVKQEAQSRIGITKASAGSSGVEGSSINALLSDFAKQEIAQIEIIERDVAQQEAVIEGEKDVVEAESAQRIFNSFGEPLQAPDLWGSILNIFASESSTATQLLSGF